MASYYEGYGAVMTECGHRHRTPEAAQRCIDRTQRGISRRPGSGGAYCDRYVRLVVDSDDPAAADMISDWERSDWEHRA